MSKLSIEQYKFLVSLSKTGEIKCDDLDESQLSIIRFLDSEGLISSKRDIVVVPSPNDRLKPLKGGYISVSISEKGKAYLRESKTNDRRWVIPVVLSAVALIKSFDREIIYIAEQLLRLIKQLSK